MRQLGSTRTHTYFFLKMKLKPTHPLHTLSWPLAPFCRKHLYGLVIDQESWFGSPSVSFRTSGRSFEDSLQERKDPRNSGTSRGGKNSSEPLVQESSSDAQPSQKLILFNAEHISGWTQGSLSCKKLLLCDAEPGHPLLSWKYISRWVECNDPRELLVNSNEVTSMMTIRGPGELDF